MLSIDERLHRNNPKLPRDLGSVANSFTDVPEWKSEMIAALFVSPRGPYVNRADVDAWTEIRDARQYQGPWPIVAHPPCASWGRYAKQTPDSKAKGPMLGQDDGCFVAALMALLAFGGVLEHPRASHAWRWFGIKAPPSGGGWDPRLYFKNKTLYTCEVEQGHYGHPAQKATWLLAVLPLGVKPPELIWGPSTPEVRGPAKARGILERMSRQQRILTPKAFADLLVSIAKLNQ